MEVVSAGFNVCSVIGVDDIVFDVCSVIGVDDIVFNVCSVIGVDDIVFNVCSVINVEVVPAGLKVSSVTFVDGIVVDMIAT